MAVVVEDGSGKTNATSYVSVTNATALLTARVDTTAWDAVDPSDQDRACALATARLDADMAGIVSGTRANVDQALAFPRSGFVDADGRSYDSDEIPSHLELATAFRAEAIATGAEAVDTGEGRLVEIDVGPIGLKYGDSTPQDTRLAWEDFMVQLVGGGGTSITVQRS